LAECLFVVMCVANDEFHEFNVGHVQSVPMDQLACHCDL
jgi:hypothetical protein